jgi:hypothetical protein
MGGRVYQVAAHSPASNKLSSLVTRDSRIGWSQPGCPIVWVGEGARFTTLDSIFNYRVLNVICNFYYSLNPMIFPRSRFKPLAKV